MGIKNQKTLFISASVVIGLTVAGLFGLNILVDKIAKISPPSMVMSETPRPPAPVGDDAASGQKFPSQMLPSGFPPPGDDRFPPKRRIPDMRERPPQPSDVVRRVRNGKDAPDLRRGPPPQHPPSRDDAVDNGQKGRAPTPPNMGGYPPPMDPSKMDPKQREEMEREMERQQQMYYGPPGGPPPGYYPPPMPPGYDDQYDNGYEGYGGEEPYDYDYNYDYDYYEDPESNLKNMATDDKKTATIVDAPPFFDDAEEDVDFGQGDDYFHEYEE